MAATYDVTQLASSTTYQVRLLIGDTLMKDVQLQDEEIAFLVTTRSTLYGAAAECCRFISAQKSRLADSVQGEMRTQYSTIARSYDRQAVFFDAKAAMSGAGVAYAGGISIADKQNQEANTDRVAPQFNIGLDDNSLPVPSVGNQTQDEAAFPGSALAGGEI